MKKKGLLTSCFFLFAACGGPPPVAENSLPLEVGTGTHVINLNKGNVVYADYSDRLIGRGKTSVLFFFKASDPFSVRSESVIRSIYGTGGAVVTTYRVDYPVATGARLRFGVVVEDTFVLLDAQGQRVANFIHPNQEEIGIILRGNIPVPSKS